MRIPKEQGQGKISFCSCNDTIPVVYELVVVVVAVQSVAAGAFFVEPLVPMDKYSSLSLSKKDQDSGSLSGRRHCC
jgi:hypothetical protein